MLLQPLEERFIYMGFHYDVVFITDDDSTLESPAIYCSIYCSPPPLLRLHWGRRAKTSSSQGFFTQPVNTSIVRELNPPNVSPPLPARALKPCTCVLSIHPSFQRVSDSVYDTDAPAVGRLGLLLSVHRSDPGVLSSSVHQELIRGRWGGESSRFLKARANFIKPVSLLQVFKDFPFEQSLFMELNHSKKKKLAIDNLPFSFHQTSHLVQPDGVQLREEHVEKVGINWH